MFSRQPGHDHPDIPHVEKEWVRSPKLKLTLLFLEVKILYEVTKIEVLKVTTLVF